MYSKLSVFDFDATLIATPEPNEESKKQWADYHGKEWPFLGWWGRKESLDTDVWDMEPNPEVLESYKKEMSDPETMVVLLTGRLEKLRPEVEGILNKHGLTFDKVLLNKGKRTILDKVEQMNDILSDNPDINEVELWDDRESHIPKFEEWGDNLWGITFKINHIK